MIQPVDGLHVIGAFELSENVLLDEAARAINAAIEVYSRDHRL